MNYWENISKIEAKQTAKGISEYGQTLEENQLPSVLERIIYIEEELVDSLKYLEWLSDGLKQAMLNNESKYDEIVRLVQDKKVSATHFKEKVEEIINRQQS